MIKQLVSVLLILLAIHSVSLSQTSAPVAKNVNAAEFAKLIVSKAGIILDVRTAPEVKKGAISNSVNIDFFADDFAAQISKLDKNKPVYVYCASGGRSGEAMAMMSKIGFKTIYNLEGGYSAWTKMHPAK
ncbi:MAG: rhodanese-like domain-containing protein [Bacteroidetes bacterium]|nr:rhodanese-like domain-containing protein [Bacteroidota bacterium]